MSARGTPETAELLRLAVATALSEVHTAIPGYVTAVDGSGQWVDVLPAVKVPGRDEDGELVEEDLPIIPRVPVGYMQGGGFFASVPIAVGDHVLIVFCERSLDQWVQKAARGTNEAVSPGHAESHGLNGAVALPVGPTTKQDQLTGVSASDMIIGLDGAPGGQIRITAGGEVHIGVDVLSDYAALATKVKAALDLIVMAIQNAATAPMDGGATFKAAIVAALAAIDTNVASDKVKVSQP